MVRLTRSRYLSLIAALAASSMLAQDPPTPTEPPATPPAAPAAGGGPGRGGPGANAQEPQPYDRVITKDAKTTPGIFTLHQIKERYYFEIPKAQLNKEFLWAVTVTKTAAGVGYGGDQVNDLVVRWELNGNKILLREIDYALTADPRNPISRAVKNANNDAILMSFNVAAFGKDGAPVIEVGRIYTTDLPELGLRQHLGATSMDSARSFIEHVSAFPENIDGEATLTFTRAQGAPGAGGGGRGPGGGQMRPGSTASIVVHHSMVKLPEKPMQPRLFDDRVGYFTTGTTDFTRDEYRAKRTRYIARWRLEKKDPSAAVSEPVKPIVYYIDIATPMKWRDAVKRGVESWQKAFEAAGFRNAIIAKMAPSPEEDPNFSHEDVRNSVIRWMPSTVENAVGPHISDPRTGEILNADIRMYHNVMNLARNWYFVQASPSDPRAQKLPLPEDLMARLVEYVVAHEVGHTLGFQHNMKASSMYEAAKVRDAEWVHRMGHTPSIMDYSRFNYVAQPEDKIPASDLIPGVGPYDIWATKWGYTPIPEAKTSEEERARLDLWAREQDTTPWYRFSTAGAGNSDFGEQSEAVGDADAIASSGFGMKNLQRVAKYLIPATTARPGEPYEDLGEIYGRLLGQWSLEMNHVASILGSFSTQTKYTGQQGRLFTPTPKARQQAALAFLSENALATPKWAIDPEVSRRIEPIGMLNRIRNAQTGMLAAILNSSRFARLVEQQVLDGPSSWAPADFLASVRRGVFSELDASQVKIDAYRRNLQRAYLDIANTKINGQSNTATTLTPDLAVATATSGDERPMYRAELRALNTQVTAALAKATDRETRAHLEGVRDQIARTLDPKFASTVGGAAAVLRPGLDGETNPDLCWPDYVITPY